MRIISKFKDYYDSVQGVLYDDSLTFIRKDSYSSTSLASIRPIYRDGATFCVIGFCGKVYPFMMFDYDEVTTKNSLIKFVRKNKKRLSSVTNFYNEEHNKFYKNKFLIIHSQDEYMHILDKVLNSFNSKTQYNNFISNISSFVSNVTSLSLFDENETPIFLLECGRNNVSINISPRLSEYKFQSVFDPYSAYQEIVMWIGNKAVNEYPPQITNNKVLRDAKGFYEMSFKTRPGTKKKRGKK